MKTKSSQAPAPASREIVCPHCDRALDVPAAAMTASCRHCNRRVVIEDQTIKAYHAVVRYATAGRVEVKKNAQLIAEVRVAELVVDGMVKGAVKATDRIEVSKKGQIIGDVTCPRLRVEPGARLLGRFRVGPDAGEPPPAEDEGLPTA
jgi:DNA-directed RNA polymerase subunit RPC12/RpoP